MPRRGFESWTLYWWRSSQKKQDQVISVNLRFFKKRSQLPSLLSLKSFINTRPQTLCFFPVNSAPGKVRARFDINHITSKLTCKSLFPVVGLTLFGEFRVFNAWSSLHAYAYMVLHLKCLAVLKEQGRGAVEEM